MTKLYVLDLGYNSLTGTIPASLGNLVGLQPQFDSCDVPSACRVGRTCIDGVCGIYADGGQSGGLLLNGNYLNGTVPAPVANLVLFKQRFLTNLVDIQGNCRLTSPLLPPTQFGTSGHCPTKGWVFGATTQEFSPGNVSTVAGTGASGAAGVPGPAVGAQVNAPYFTVFEPTTGNLYVSVSVSQSSQNQNGGFRLRVITPDGMISALSSPLIDNNGPAFAVYNKAIYGTVNGAVGKFNTTKTMLVAGIPGKYGFSGDNGPATAATFGDLSRNQASLYGLAFDKSGNLYISDSYNLRVRMVSAKGNTITTVAGSGVSVSVSGPPPAADATSPASPATPDPFPGRTTGDGGPATLATIALPSGLAIDDATRSLYISETLGNRVRKVNLVTGIITTIVGDGAAAYKGDLGAAVAASVSSPVGLVSDGNGKLYIADLGNNVLRVWDSTTGFIYTIAGSRQGKAGSKGDRGPATGALLNQPVGVALDAIGGYLYVADSMNNVVRRIDVSQITPKAAALQGSPTRAPTRVPTWVPTVEPTAEPSTSRPTTAKPSAVPTQKPSYEPTFAPTYSQAALLQAQLASDLATVANDTSAALGPSTVLYTDIIAKGAVAAGGCKPWVASTGSYLAKMLVTDTAKSITLQQYQQLSFSAGTYTRVTYKCRSDTAAATGIIQAIAGTGSVVGTNLAPLNYTCDGNNWIVRKCPQTAVVGISKPASLCVNCVDPCKQKNCPSLATVNPCVLNNTAVNYGCATAQTDLAGFRIVAINTRPKSPPPAVKNTTSVVTKTSIALTAFLSASSDGSQGTIYVGAYPSGSPPTSVANVQMQNNVATAASRKASVLITGLSPATAYDLYVVTQSADGTTMTLSSALATKTTIKTTCCKTISVGLAVNGLYQTQGAAQAVSLSLDTPPTTSVRVFVYTVPTSTTGPHVSTAGAFNYKQVATIPGNFSFTPNSLLSQVASISNRSTVFLGVTNLYVVVQGPSKAEYAVTFPNGKNFTTLSTSSPLPPPKLLSVAMSDDGIYLLATFDGASDKAGVTAAQFPCGNLFKTVVAPGAWTCGWASSSEVLITLDASAALTIGSAISLVSSNQVKAPCAVFFGSTDEHTCDNWPTSPAVALTVAAPTNPVGPVVNIAAPTSVGPCATFSIDISASTGNCGRSWTSVNFTVSTNATFKPVLQQYISRHYTSPSLPVKVRVCVCACVARLHGRVASHPSSPLPFPPRLGPGDVPLGRPQPHHALLPLRRVVRHRDGVQLPRRMRAGYHAAHRIRRVRPAGGFNRRGRHPGGQHEGPSGAQRRRVRAGLRRQQPPDRPGLHLDDVQGRRADLLVNVAVQAVFFVQTGRLPTLRGQLVHVHRVGF